MAPAGNRQWTRTTTTPNVLGSLPKIRRLVREGSRDPRIRLWATKILNDAGVEGRDDFGEVRAILRYAQSRIPYRRDPAHTEGLQSALFQLRSLECGAQGADCDDFTIALGSLLGSVGYPIRLAVTRPYADLPFGHIYPEVFVPSLGRWLSADATNVHADLGWEFPHYAEKRLYDMNTGTLSGPLDLLRREADRILGVGRDELERRGIRLPIAGANGSAPIEQKPLPLWRTHPIPFFGGLAVTAGVVWFLFLRKKR